MAIEIGYVILAILIMAACFILGFKFGMRQGKKITLAVQAEMRRRESDRINSCKEYIPSLADIIGNSNAIRSHQEKKETR
jgi:hypothetical protein